MLSPPLSIERSAVVDGTLFLHGEVGSERITQAVVCDEAGTPQRASLLAMGPGSPVRLGEDVVWMSERGVHYLRETEEIAGIAGIEVARFLPFDFGFPVLAASALADGALVAGISGDGRVAVRRFDGLDVLPVPGVPEVSDVIDVALAATADGAALGVVTRERFQLLRFRSASNEITQSDPIDVGGDPIGVVATDGSGDGSGTASMLLLVDQPAGVTALRFDVSEPVVSAGPLELGPFPGLTSETRVVGLAIGSGGGAEPLFESGGKPVGLSLPAGSGPQVTPAPVSIASWLALRARFALPMSLHLFVLVAMTFIWRRPVRRAPMVMGPDGKSYEVLMPFAAPIRRAGALIVDALIAVVVGTFLCRVALLPAESMLLQHSAEAMVEAFQQEIKVVPPIAVISAALVNDVGIAMLFVITGMCAFLEAFRGQTLGKRLFGIRTVCRDGTPITPGAAAARAMLLIVDVFPSGFNPPMPILGASLVLFTKRRTRLGDLAAGTVVIDPRRGGRRKVGESVRFKVQPGSGLADAVPPIAGESDPPDQPRVGPSSDPSPPDKIEPGAR